MKQTASVQTLSSGEQQEMPENANFRLARIERDIEALIGGFALLGIRRCSQCGKFFRTGDSGALFDCGDLVCFGCVPAWWSFQSPALCLTDRDRLQSKLASWLRKYHNAQVVKDPAKLPEPHRCEIRLKTGCVECGGSGKLLEGERCRFCNGDGAVFVVVLKQAGHPAGA